MQFNDKELIALIYDCTGLDKKIIEKEILPTVICENGNILFKMKSEYYVLPSKRDTLSVCISFTDEIYRDGNAIQECLIMNPSSQDIIDTEHLFYYVSLKMLKELKS